MNSAEYPPKPGHEFQMGPEQSSERGIHPDTLKFMGMAKELLDSPAIQQSIEAELQEDQADSLSSASQSSPNYSLPDQKPEAQSKRSPEPADQPDTLNFMSMAKELLSNPAIQSSVVVDQQNQSNSQS